MRKTQFLIGQDGLNFHNDFYPDDLPQEWRFDYYATSFEALSLPIDTDEDLPQILAELGDSDEAFELVLSIKYAQLTNTQQRSALLSLVSDYPASFTLFCQVDAAPAPAVMDLLANYRICFASERPLKLALNQAAANAQYFAFNHYPVLVDDAPEPQKIRAYLQQIKRINTKSILILRTPKSETLRQIRIIAESLGF